MTFRQEEKQIGKYIFSVNSMPYSDAMKVLTRGKTLLTMMAAGKDLVKDTDFTPLTAAVFVDVSEEDLDFVVNKLAERCRVKEEGGQFMPLASQKEIIFAAHQIEILFKWLDFSLGVNFSGFLDELRKANQLQNQAASKSQNT